MSKSEAYHSDAEWQVVENLGHASRYNLFRAWGAARALAYEVGADAKVFWDLAHDFDWDFIQPTLKTIPIFAAIIWDGLSSLSQSMHIKQISHHYSHTGDIRLLDLLALDIAGVRQKDIPLLSKKERLELQASVSAPTSLQYRIREFRRSLSREGLERVSKGLRNISGKKAAKIALTGTIIPVLVALKVGKDILKLHTLPSNMVKVSGIALRHTWEAVVYGADNASRHLGPLQEVFDRKARPALKYAHDMLMLCLEADSPKKSDIPLEKLPERTRKRGERQFRMLAYKNVVNLVGIGFQSWFVYDTAGLVKKFSDKVSCEQESCFEGFVLLYNQVGQAYQEMNLAEFYGFVKENIDLKALHGLLAPFLNDQNVSDTGLYILTTLLASASLNHMLDYHKYLDRVRQDKIFKQIEASVMEDAVAPAAE